MIGDLNGVMRKEAARILKEGLVDVVIGFQTGSMPLRAQPAFIRSAEKVDRLISGGFCHMNLAKYLTRRPRSERLGLICRGCESRAAGVLVGEQQHVRENLYLIGIPCEGIIDRRRIESVAGVDVLSAEETGDEVLVRTRDKVYRFKRSEVVHGACSRCRFPDPVGVDVIIGEASRERGAGPVEEEAEEFDLLTADERYTEFSNRADRCIRCYACRQACPMCYCGQCFVDYTTPRWSESMVSPAGTQAWHIMRAFHQTGRCIGCGACERACPMDIKMMYLTAKLNRYVEKSYGFVPGNEENEPPPFAAFSTDEANRLDR